MAAAFGSGALFSIVSGMGTPNPVTNAVTTGMAFAVFQGGFFMVCTTLGLVAALLEKSLFIMYGQFNCQSCFKRLDWEYCGVCNCILIL